jgi:hypothetical protein
LWVFFILMWIPLVIVVFSALKKEEDPPVLALGLFFILFIRFTILLVGSFGIGWIEKENIKKKGMPAKATIINFSDTGILVNNQPQLSIELEVQPSYDSRFRTTVEYGIPNSALPQSQPGKTVSVYYIEETKEVALADL